VGQTLAKVEMAVMFKELFARYDVERGWDGTERVMGEGLTCPMKGGLPIKVSRR
jgi:cytochrome P450